jgi:outer membrane protein assembly factor BamB
LHAIQVKCPNCAAVLRVSADAMTVDCEYCHTQSQVQRRTRMLQLPVKMLPPPPPPRPGAPSGPPPRSPMRAARQVVRRSMIVVTTVAGLLPFVGFGAVFLAMRGHFEQAADVVREALRPAARTVGAIGGGGAVAAGDRDDGSSWVGISAPIFTDVDDDEVADLLGRIRYVQDGDRVHLVAVSGATGKRLWQSPTIGTYGDTIQSRTSVLGDVVLFANSTGALSAFERASGKTRFTASLPDRAERFCRRGEGAVVVEAADGTWHQLALADGAARKVRKEARCERVVHDERESVDPALAVTRPRRWSQAGMRVERVLRRGRGPAVATGWRSRGTSVPMVAGLDARGRVTWKAEVPDGRPLEASQGSGGLWTVTGQLLCGTYQRTGRVSSTHVTCFALDDGKRAWDLVLPPSASTPLTSLVSSGERLYLSGWGLLLGIDGATGQWMSGVGR